MKPNTVAPFGLLIDDNPFPGGADDCQDGIITKPCFSSLGESVTKNTCHFNAPGGGFSRLGTAAVQIRQQSYSLNLCQGFDQLGICESTRDDVVIDNDLVVL